MLKTKFVLLLAIASALAISVGAQSAETAIFNVTVVDSELNLSLELFVF